MQSCSATNSLALITPWRDGHQFAGQRADILMESTPPGSAAEATLDVRAVRGARCAVRSEHRPADPVDQWLRANHEFRGRVVTTSVLLTYAPESLIGGRMFRRP
jgi:hypothetical protein